MKTRMSQRILLIVGLSALLVSPAFAAFGDDTAPSPNTLSDSSAAGSALPPGTYPSSPSDSDKKTETAPKEKASPSPAPHKQPSSKATKKKTAHTGS
ncbi:hypothetical protein NTD80_22815 [Pseudomonas sp. 13B_2.1_Bac1]|nr:hypothetical protein [Pseudomonas sp. 13B_2.1_Bac1]MCU1785585.1 hypothetical protein [Pseudomonas sp. 13B_2.1_Bac1]